MSVFNKLALSAVATMGVLGFMCEAQAQNYEENVRRYQPQIQYYQQPQYVNPKIARKQAQQEQRAYQKYGYQQPQHYGYGYQQPQYHQQQQYYYQQAPQQYYAPAPRGYYYN